MPLRFVKYASLASWLRSIEHGRASTEHPWAVLHGQPRVPDYPGPEWYGAANVESALAKARDASASEEAARVRALSNRLAMRLSAPRATVTEYILSPIGRLVDYAAWQAGIEPCTLAAMQVAQQRPSVHVMLDTCIPANLPGAMFVAYAAAVAACCSKIAAACNLRVTACFATGSQNLCRVSPTQYRNAWSDDAVGVGCAVDIKAWQEPWHSGTMAWSLCALAAARALPFAWLDCYATGSESAKIGSRRGYPLPVAAGGYIPSDTQATVVIRVPWLITTAYALLAEHDRKSDAVPAEVTAKLEASVIRAFLPCGIRPRD